MMPLPSGVVLYALQNAYSSFHMCAELLFVFFNGM